MDFAIHFRGDVYPITRRGLVVGRAAGADIVIANNLASRQHCSIRCERGRVLISDLRSQRGTFVNGRQLSSGEHELRTGDRIEVGEQGLLVIELTVRHSAPPDLSRLLRPVDETTSIHRLRVPTASLPDLGHLLRPQDESESYRRVGASPDQRRPIAIEPKRAVLRPLGWVPPLGHPVSRQSRRPARPAVPKLARPTDADEEVLSLRGMAQRDQDVPDLSGLVAPKEKSSTRP